MVYNIHIISLPPTVFKIQNADTRFTGASRIQYF